MAPYMLLAVAATLLAFAVHIDGWRWARALDNIAIDMGFRLRGETDPRVIADLPQTRNFLIVELDHQLPRPVLAALVDQLRLAQVVALDLMISDREAELSPDDRELPVWKNEILRWRNENQLLAASFKRSNNVVLGVWPERSRSEPIMDAEPAAVNQAVRPQTGVADAAPGAGWRRPPAVMWGAARWHAHLRVEPDENDGLVRRVRLAEMTPFAPEPLPSFSLAAAHATSLRDGASVNASTTVDSPDSGMLIDYLGGVRCFEDERVRIVASRVLNDCEPEDFRGLTVFVGETDWSSKDIFPTPFGDIPGVHIQANAAATLLKAGGALSPAAPAWTLLLSLVSCLLILAPLVRWPLWSATLATVLLTLVLALGIACLAAWGKLALPLSTPLLAITLTYNAVVLLEMRRARTTLGRFIGAELASRTLRPLESVQLGGKTEFATAFFCDLRGYSALAESIAPQMAAELLRAYTTTVTKVVQQHGGRPIDYLGDGVFVLFEGRHTRGEHAFAATLAAIDVQRKLADVAARWRETVPGDGAPLVASIAIHSGDMLIGLVGDEHLLKPGAVGDAVNVAAHAQSYSKQTGHHILVTRETVSAMESKLDGLLFDLELCGSYLFKDRQNPVELLGVVPHAT